MLSNFVAFQTIHLCRFLDKTFGQIVRGVSLKSGTVYWKELDGLRALAITLVFLHHCTPRTTEGQPAYLWAPIKIFSWGWVGVDLFFVLSGFLITYLLLQERASFQSISIWRFYARRAIRIWPLYFSVLIGVSVYPLFLHHWNSSYRSFLETIIIPFFLFYGNYAVMNHTGDLLNFTKHWGLSWALYIALIEPFWSLCVEEQFYLVWPTVLNLVRNKTILWLTMFCVFCSAVVARYFLVQTAIAHNFDASFYYINTVSHIDALMIGAGLAAAEYANPYWFKRYSSGIWGGLIASGTIGVLLALMFFSPSIFDRDISISWIMSLFSACFGVMILLTINWAPFKNFFSIKPFTSVGRVSYGMYVCHFACIGWAQSFSPFFADNSVATWICLVVTAYTMSYGLALLSWTCLESKLLKLRKHFHRVEKVPVLVPDTCRAQALLPK